MGLPVIRSQTVSIGRGENSGRQVTYTNVVRGWVRIGTWDGDKDSFKVPVNQLRFDGANAVVVLVQSGTFAAPGAILGAAKTFPSTDLPAARKAEPVPRGSAFAVRRLVSWRAMRGACAWRTGR